MKRQSFKALTAGTVFAGLIVGGILFSSKSGQAAMTTMARKMKNK